MPLQPGDKLGPYEIVALIGAGGMGEVYKALDARLDRPVALKVIRTGLLEQHEALLRFEKEARLLASLNHARIATIHGFEEFSGTRFLVLEYVPGPTLAERLRRGPLSVQEAMRVGKQIAEALEAAHSKGIIHRDLKPANIKICEGQVKVLDFGLAKSIVKQGPGRRTAENDETVTQDLTREGTVVGTAAYMSPEQACGQELDVRTDIWSFGCVLYEALTAKRAFGGRAAAEILGAVIEREPDWEALPDDLPEAVSTLLRRCLQKDPGSRLRDIADARFLIEDASASPTYLPPASKLPWIAAVALAFVLIASAALLWRGTPSVEKPLFVVDLDLGTPVSPPSSGADFLLSPDGTQLAFVSQGSDGISHLSARRIDQPQTTELPNTEGAYDPFFSPDGKWLGFFAKGKLRKIPIEGGEAITLADAPAGRGASWSETGIIVAALDTRSGLSQVSATGGAVTQLTELDRTRGDVTHRWPQVLPGGKAVLFTSSAVTADFDGASIELVSLADRRTKIVLDRVGTFGRFVSSGHLVYISKGTLFAVPFDLERMEVRGTALAVLERVSYDPGKGFSQLGFSQSGSALYRGGSGTLARTLQWLDGAGEIKTLRAKPGNYQFPRLSPDGGRLAVTIVDGSNTDIWVYDLQRDLATRLTTGPGIKEFPVWTPDGRSIIFEWQNGPTMGMYWAPADGAGKPEKLTESKYAQSPGNFTPDGKRLVYGELKERTGSDIRTLQVEDRSGQLYASKSEVLLSTPSANPYPSFSPDGNWLAYSSTESGTYQVFVRAFQNTGSQTQVSNDGGMMPVWSRAAHELFYRTEDQRLMVADYAVNGNSFVVGKPQIWYREPLANLGLTINFDLAPGGKRFAVVLPVGGKEPPEALNHVTLLLNFFDELRRRVPAAK
jgi:serine/threonine protein kinase